MLSELRIADLGVIDEVVIEPSPGFTAVTGETGAGKTMVVNSLALLLGGRGDPRLIRHDAGRALVEGRWRLTAAEVERIAELGGDTEDGEVIVSRQVTPTRSRSFVGGVGVPAATAGELVAEWATIHGQSEQARLATAERQREVLDRFAGPDLAAELATYSREFAERREALGELQALTTRSQDRARELDLLSFGLDEIAKVDPQPGEDVALAAEARRLQAVDDLRLSVGAAQAALAGDDDGYGEGNPALATLAAARKALSGAVGADESLAPLADRLAEAGYLVADIAAELTGYLSGLEADPLRLEWIAERRADLQRLTRKYGTTVDEVLAWAAEAARRMQELASGDERREVLAARVAALETRLRARAEVISGLRRAAADRLAAAVHDELVSLALPRARLEFRVSAAADLGPHGVDQVSLLFSAHPAAEPGPLGKVASGGELSRVRLALEVVLAGTATGQTFVFDEVDAGVGGAVALEIGRRLAQLAEFVQVIVVTHLAQVAAFADKHYVVHKADQGLVTTSDVTEVAGARRQEELARMMGGLASSESALAHAAELLTEAGKRRH